MAGRRVSFLPGLEGLRGVAILAVLLFHAMPEWVRGGFLGVSTFFTLSGFLITGLLVIEREQTGRIVLSSFWARRIRRLLPASLLGLLGIGLGAAVWGDAAQLERLRGDGLATIAYVANWWMIATGGDYASLTGSPSLVQHFWSLSVEEQYYLFYPLVTVAVLHLASGSRRVYGMVLSAAALASWAWMAWLATSGVPTARIYLATDTRCAELLAGGVLALVLLRSDGARRALVSKALSWAGVAALGVCCGYWLTADVESAWLYLGGFPVYTAATVVLVAASAEGTGPVQAVLARPELRWLGRVSYGAYVYHWPVFLWVDDAATGLTGLPLAAIRFAITLVLAELSYRLLEEPVRTGRLVLGWRRWAAPPAAMVVVAGVLLAATSGYPLVPLAASTLQSERSATEGAAPGALRVAVVGDSLANVIGKGLLAWEADGALVVVENFARPGCGIARGAWPTKRGRQTAHCDDWDVALRPQIERFAPDLVVVSTAGWDLLERELPQWGGVRVIGDPDFDRWLLDQYEAALGIFTRDGARVVWLTTPCFESRKGRTTGVFDPRRSRRLNQLIARLTNEHPTRMTLVDLDSEICPNGEFTNSLHGIEDFRPDGIHFSEHGARWVGKWLGEQLVELASRRSWAR